MNEIELHLIKILNIYIDGLFQGGRGTIYYLKHLKILITLAEYIPVFSFSALPQHLPSGHGQ